MKFIFNKTQENIDALADLYDAREEWEYVFISKDIVVLVKMTADPVDELMCLWRKGMLPKRIVAYNSEKKRKIVSTFDQYSVAGGAPYTGSMLTKTPATEEDSTSPPTITIKIATESTEVDSQEVDPKTALALLEAGDKYQRTTENLKKQKTREEKIASAREEYHNRLANIVEGE